MALQEIVASIQLSKGVEPEDNKLISAKSSEGEHQNGSIEDNSTLLTLEKEEPKKDPGTTEKLINVVPLTCDINMPFDVSDVDSCIISVNKTNDLNAASNFDICERNESSSHNASLERVNSSENSSSDLSSSDEPSIFEGNSTEDPLDSAQEELKRGKHDCLEHPSHKITLEQIEKKNNEVLELHETVQRLKELLSAETLKASKVDELEKKIVQYEREVEISKKEQEIEKRTFEAVKKECDHKYNLLKKEFETANREKENMVMRYAVSEKELIDTKKEKEALLKKLKDSAKENDTLTEKVKNYVTEKTKISQLLDTKNADLSNAHKEIDKLKEDINSRDIKIKWTQNKLKTEMEVHKECPQQIDKLTMKVKILEEELAAATLEAQNLRKELQESEPSKVLESQLKEHQAKLIMERHEHSEIESKYKNLQQKHHSMIEENNSLSFQVQRLETERLEMEKKLSSSREETEKLSNLVLELQSKLVEMDSLTSQLKQSEDKVNSLLTEMDRVRHQNEELLQDMSACRAKETEMLSFTQKLTTKNVQLQSEFSTIETKAADLEKSEEKCRNEVKELKERAKDLQNQLNKEKVKREEETRLLARQIAEKKKKGEMVEAELQDTKATLTQTKTKHATAVKELQRELSLLNKKLEKLEAHGSFRQSESLNSLTDSNFMQVCDLPTQNLVERILKLQGDNAKLAEKIEFLEEHSAHLLSEVQRKSRLLQSYMLREEAGALAPNFLDNHKAEVSKHGGIMASLYGAAPQDDGMSLELCLEINRKLQAVLEDTLLKNIMLKENIDTLGDEISRLTSNK